MQQQLLPEEEHESLHGAGDYNAQHQTNCDVMLHVVQFITF